MGWSWGWGEHVWDANRVGFGTAGDSNGNGFYGGGGVCLTCIYIWEGYSSP